MNGVAPVAPASANFWGDINVSASKRVPSARGCGRERQLSYSGRAGREGWLETVSIQRKSERLFFIGDAVSCQTRRAPVHARMRPLSLPPGSARRCCCSISFSSLGPRRQLSLSRFCAARACGGLGTLAVAGGRRQKQNAAAVAQLADDGSSCGTCHGLDQRAGRACQLVGGTQPKCRACPLPAYGRILKAEL